LQGFSTPEKFDCIVSNPPYIGLDERPTIPQNVDRFEPHLALYAPQQDTLIFYRALCAQAPNLLKSNGWLVTEVNERLAGQVQVLFEENGFDSVVITRDLYNKERIVRAQWRG
jgi:release factor glutamine methyltransferase